MDKTAKSAITRDRIYRAALDLFEELGYEESTMRQVAARTDMATGAAYYYFPSKPAIVMEFYKRTAADLNTELPARLKRTRDLKKRLEAVPALWLEKFGPHRGLMRALLTAGLDPKNELSPFSPDQQEIRSQAIGWYAQAVEGSTVRIPADLSPILPRLLWLYQMGIILYWLYDSSSDQKRTCLLLSGTLELICLGLKLSTLPMMGVFRKKVATVARAAGVEEL